MAARIGRTVGPGGQGGYTYLVLMVLLAVMALGAALTLEVVQTRVAREREARLLAVGHEFEQAFSTYFRLTPVGQSPYPRRLEDLLRDPRYPGVRRHLRRIYADPLDAQRAWGLVAAPGGGIMGVYSLAPGKPLREDPGPLSLPILPIGGIEGSTPFSTPFTQPAMPATLRAMPPIAITSYAQWRFGYDPQVELARRQNALAPPTSTLPTPSSSLSPASAPTPGR